MAAAIPALLVLLLTGCKLVKLRYDLHQLAMYGGLRGTVSNLPAAGTAVYVLIFKNDPTGPQLVEWERVKADGGYFAMVPSGIEYQVVVFADVNGNRRWDAGEPADLAAQISIEPMAGEEMARTVSFSLRAGPRLPDSLRMIVPGDITREHTSATVSLGEVVHLDEPRFSAEAGRTGQWEPYKFLVNYGMGIFFVEPYDPKRIPVLFVYGAEGSPQDWRYIIENLDRSRFQCWFFHYATGIRLESWSLGLNSMVQQLHGRLQFRRLFVVAHSMGGLVARDFILRNTLDDHQEYIARFVSISTPWEGHNAAGSGVKLSPVVVPSWNDLLPTSSFLKSLFLRKLPGQVRYYLIFGYKNSIRPWLSADNDGVVGLASQLSLPAQHEARRIFGLNLDHNAILNSQETLLKLEEFLSE